MNANRIIQSSRNSEQIFCILAYLSFFRLKTSHRKLLPKPIQFSILGKPHINHGIVLYILALYSSLGMELGYFFCLSFLLSEYGAPKCQLRSSNNTNKKVERFLSAGELVISQTTSLLFREHSYWSCHICKLFFCRFVYFFKVEGEQDLMYILFNWVVITTLISFFLGLLRLWVKSLICCIIYSKFNKFKFPENTGFY